LNGKDGAGDAAPLELAAAVWRRCIAVDGGRTAVQPTARTDQLGTIHHRPD
jgi:hypothetical protein